MFELASDDGTPCPPSNRIPRVLTDSKLVADVPGFEPGFSA